MTRSLRYLLPALMLMWPMLATAQDMPIDAFYGQFQGSGIAQNEDSLYFGVTVRDVDVKIGALDQGFYVEWTSVIRSGGDPNNPDIRRRTARVDFAPGDRPGVFPAQNSGNLLAGEPVIWARLADQTLTIHVIAMAEDGGYQVQTYDRTLTGNGMELKFISIRDGEAVRQVTARLVKVAR
ncbi:MAG: hypothetical protein ACTSX7_15620 [Alphaproteobacteria bacterium]